MSQPNQALQKPTFTAAITSGGYQKLINGTLGDPERAKRFTASIISAVTATPALQECEAKTIVAAAFLGEALNLSPSPQLGQYYLVPFKNKKAGTVSAQFILGYKGYLQLAQRSGQLRSLDALEVKQGEIVRCDPFRGVYEFNPIQDPEEREYAETVGYYAYFEMLNGFRKEIYWTKAQMMRHAEHFSQAFSSAQYQKLCAGAIPGLTLEMVQRGAYVDDRELYKVMARMSSFWYKDFDDMARKTMLRQLISKHGCPMSTEMTDIVEKDGAVQTVNLDTGEVITIQDDTPNAHETAASVNQQSEAAPPPNGLDEL
jgi:recombination protein RecT